MAALLKSKNNTILLKIIYFIHEKTPAVKHGCCEKPDISKVDPVQLTVM